MEKNKLWLFLILFALSFDSFAQIKDVPVVKLFDKEYYKYEVKSKETLYSICRKFNVTEGEILSMNPFIVNGLKSKQTLMIPVNPATDATEKDRISSKDKEPVKTEARDQSTKKRKAPRKADDLARITLILPFNTTASSSTNDKYIEFYEGLLMAVDSLKSLGLSFEVQALESGNDTEAINHAILTGKLDQTDYLIGGVTPDQISILSKWAQKNQKMLLIPFSSRVTELETNPYIIQTLTPYSYLNEKLIDFAAVQMERSNVLFLTTRGKESDSQASLIVKLKKELKSRGINYTEVAEDEELTALNAALKEGLENNLIPCSVSLSEVNDLVTRLSVITTSRPDIKLSLWGYPEWQVMNRSIQKHLYDLDTYIFANFFADIQNQDVRNFQIDYSRNFGKTLLNTYPKYGMMGYDIANFFIPRMIHEKSDNRERVPSIDPLQNDFKFSTKSRMGGSFNKVFYVIHYTKKNTTEIIPLQ